MTTTPSTGGKNNNDVVIEPLQEKYFRDAGKVLDEFLDSKHMCCCLPLGGGEARSLRRLKVKEPNKFATTAVAVKDGKAVGVVKLLLPGTSSMFHTPKAGEAYIYQLAVSSDARGMGIGTKLLQWCDHTARQNNCTFITLNVVKNNPAVGLYEKRGYAIQPSTSCCEEFWGIAILCFFFSPCICPLDSSFYMTCGRAHTMKKELNDGNENT